MWEWLSRTISEFKSCFSRKRAYIWFAVLVVGLMVRSDHLGITSIVREFDLCESAYNGLIHFFKSNAWYLPDIRLTWLKLVSKSEYLIMEAGRYIMIGDGVKQAKEGRRMPGVKKLHQESDNSAKGEYINGHLFGGLGILAGNGKKMYSILLSLRIHDGISAIQKWWEGDAIRGMDCYSNEESHVQKSIRDAGEAVKRLGASILILDRLYLTVPMLTLLARYPDLCVVTKAKSNATAYFPPGKYKGRGARAKKGASVKVASFFGSHMRHFKQAKLNMYGKDEMVKYFCVDFLWGKGMYRPLRFVLTDISGTRSILVSTDSTLTPVQVIELYCKRFKIECSFRELKQVISGFAYHFWSKSMPKLRKYQSNNDNQSALASINDNRQRELITNTVKAIEGFVQLALIALGLLQLGSLMFHSEVENSNHARFLRTKSNEIPSERTVAAFLRKNIYRLLAISPQNELTTIIKSKQIPFESPHQSESA